MCNELVILQDKNNGSKSTSIKKLMSTTAMMAVALLASSPVSADPLPSNSWDYDVVLDGNVGKDISVAGITDITVTGGNGFVEGNADIYAGHSVNVTGNSNATFAYRDNRANIESTLNGNLNSNMNIVIIDKDGMFFTGDSRINVGSLVSTSADIAVADIMDGGDLTFSNVGDGGAITINGRITVAEAGLAAFVSPFVTNNGIINAKMGNVIMAAGETVTLDFYGDGLVEVAVNGELADALLENTDSGRINAEGGVVQMTALAAKDAVDNIINVKGIVNASSATVQGGKIILSGGDSGVVHVAGTLDASGVDGGEISVTGDKVIIAEAAELIVDVSEDSQLSGDGGDVYVNGVTSTAFVGNISSEANGDGVGGTVEVSGGSLSLGGTIDVSTGGKVIFDPVTFTIGAAESSTIVLAMSSGADVDVSAEETITVNAEIDSSAQGNTSTLTFADEDANDDLTVNLNKNITVGANQTLAGEATVVNVTVDAEIQDGITIAKNNATVNVAEGTYNEAVIVDVEGLTLNGANAGVGGNGSRGAETIISSAVVSGDDVSVDGFTMNNGVNGIDISDTSGAAIQNNIISGALNVGVFGNNVSTATIDSNMIDNTGADGIKIKNGDNIEITGNYIGTKGGAGNIGDHGIDVKGTYIDLIDTILIDNNVIRNTESRGIDFGYIDNFTITSNNIADTGTSSSYTDGIHGDDSSNGVIGGSFANRNIIRAGGHGINLDDISDSEISFNDIETVQNNGIELEESNDVDILSNVINNTGDNGIELGEDDENTLISGNIIKNSSGDGIHADETNGTLIISNNIIEGSEDNGIRLSDTDIATILGNTISDNGQRGLYGYWEYNDNVILAGNTFTNNPVGARFESGVIDLTGVANIFNGGDVALQFAPATTYSKRNPFADLSLVGDTIGSTVFNGTGTYYVELLNGAFFDPGTPTLINGTDATFDGVNPSSFAGAKIPQSSLDAIEAKLFDFDDDNTVGQIFIGLLGSAATLENLQDFLPNVDLATGGSAKGATVVINGLPPIGGSTPTGGLNNIAPAAGGSGDGSEEFANINPAAGDDEGQDQATTQEVTCLGDVLGSLSSGSVAYSFGGSFEDSIAGASACSTNAI